MTIDFTDWVADGINKLQPYLPGKPIEELERELGISNTVKLASNENPLGPSPKGREAAAKAVEQINLYPDDAGYRLRGRLAGKLEVEPDSLVLGSGSSDVIDMVTRTFLGPGCNAVYSLHAFAMYPIYTTASGAEGKVAAPLPADHPHMPYGHDLDAMAALVDSQTRVVFIANPNNPTGTWLTRDALTGFLEQLPGRVIVVLDEAYIEYVTEDGFPDGVSMLADYPNLIVTRTFSKIYGLAGLRVGYGVASPVLASLISRVRHPFNVNAPALAAAEAALDDGQFLAQSIKLNRQGMQQFQNAFDALGLAYIPSVGNFITVDLQRPGAEVYQAMLEQGIILRPLGNYDLPRHLRITIGTETENARCIEALEKVL